MIAAAIAGYLTAAGLSPVRVAVLGDYKPGAGPVWAIYDEPGRDLPRLDLRGREIYEARLQIRARADNMMAAVAAVDQAYRLVRDADKQELIGGERKYRVVRTETINRPRWIPSPTAGELAVANIDLLVEELP